MPVFDGTLTSPVGNLSPPHWQELEASGLTPETIRAAGIRTEDNAITVAVMLNRKSFPKTQLPVLVFPFFRLDGSLAFHRVKPTYDRLASNGKDRPKYLTPSDAGNEVYLPQLVEWPRIANDPAIELIITEGEKKALCIEQNGFHCIGLTGVDCFVVTNTMRLVPALKAFKWTGRRVFIAFDSDRADKPNVLLAESKLARLLKEEGADVRVVQIPSREDGGKMGADDFIVANGAAAWQQLLREAGEPIPLNPGEYKETAGNIDPSREAAAMLDLDKADGVPRLRFWQDSFYRWHHGRFIAQPDAEIRGRAIRFLDRRFIKLKSGDTSNVLDHLRSQAMILDLRDAPSWIPGDAPEGPARHWDNREIVNCRNGLLHLPSFTSGEPNYLLPATPRYFSHTALDYDFDPNAALPERWLSFLDSVWPDDAAAIDLLQEWFGLALVPDTQFQKILIVIGPTRSGKGTIFSTLAALVGEECTCAPSMSELATQFGLWPMLDTTVAMIPDARISGRSDLAAVVSRLLSVSGEDPVDVQRKNLPTVRGVRLKSRIMIAGNELPNLGDSSMALAGRMLVLQMRESFKDREDHNLKADIRAERQGILLWAIQGWKRLRENGRFTRPESGDELRQQFVDITAPITSFARERLVFKPTIKTASKELFDAWKKWCEESGQFPGANSVFFRNLCSAFPSLRRVQARDTDARFAAYSGVGIQLDPGADF